MVLKICCAQLDFVVGDILGNAQKIIAAARNAHAAGACLLVTPELALSGGPGAADLFLRPSFVAACEGALATVAKETAALTELTLLIGHPARVASHAAQARSVEAICTNSASAVHAGRVIATTAKRLHASAATADEWRTFVTGSGDPLVFECAGFRIGVMPGFDGSDAESLAALKASGADIALSIGASDFYEGGATEREHAVAAGVRAAGLPLVSAHLVGGQDESVYEGRSFAVDAGGKLAGRAPSFEEQLFYVEIEREGSVPRIRADVAAERDSEADLWSALVLGLRDYARKNGFSSAALGLSGGIDSAMVLALAVDAIGAANVRVLLMPSDYTAAMSVEDGRELSRRLGVRCDAVPIKPLFESFKASLAPLFAGRPEDTTEENLQARIRAVLLMALSNKYRSLILETSNKSEDAAGYATLYGDMCGGFAPITDVFKTRVYELARWRNAHDPFASGANPIPGRIIARPPSAELRPGQTDQDSLPPYDLLDAIVKRYVEGNASVADLIAEGYEARTVEQVVRLIKTSEYKRRQSVIGTRVTRRNLGADWRYPVANQFLA